MSRRLWQNSIPLYKKRLRDISGIKDTTKHSKSNLLKPITNNRLNREKLETITLKSGARQGWSFSPYLLNIVVEDLSRTTKRRKDN